MAVASEPYTPSVLVSTEDLPEKEWLEYRHRGIGGSDAAAILGISPFATARDLYPVLFGKHERHFMLLTIYDPDSIAHSDSHRNRKTVPMLWRESADYITRTTNPYPLSQYSCHSSCLAALFQTPWSYIVITTLRRASTICACPPSHILSVSHFYFLKNATTTAPGPAWVPITLPTVV